MKPTRSAKRTETSRRSAGGRRALRALPVAAGGVERERRPHSPQNFSPGSFAAPHDRAGDRERPVRTRRRTSGPRGSRCRSSGRSRRHPGCGGATASSRSSHGRRPEPLEDLARLGERAPPSPGRASPCSSSVTASQNGSRARGSARRPPRKCARSPPSVARKRCAWASSNGGRFPRGALDDREQLLDLRHVAEAKRRLERLDEPQLDGLERRSRDAPRPRRGLGRRERLAGVALRHGGSGPRRPR